MHQIGHQRIVIKSAGFQFQLGGIGADRIRSDAHHILYIQIRADSLQLFQNGVVIKIRHDLLQLREIGEHFHILPA